MNKILPYPRMCPKCGKRTVQAATIRHTANVKYEGKIHSVEIPELHVGQCSCGEVLFDLESDEQIDTAFRRAMKLLTADEIRAGRRRLRMKQGDLAHNLGIAKATISRWENRFLIQSKAMDRLLRIYFHAKSVRRLMQRLDSDPSIGTHEAVA